MVSPPIAFHKTHKIPTFNPNNPSKPQKPINQTRKNKQPKQNKRITTIRTTIPQKFQKDTNFMTKKAKTDKRSKGSLQLTLVFNILS